jgi:hypothetical protein
MLSALAPGTGQRAPVSLHRLAESARQCDKVSMEGPDNGDERLDRFRTKTGTCIITAERLVLEREGVAGTAAGALVGGSVNRILVIYVVLTVVLAVLGLKHLLEGDVTMGGVLCGFALYLTVGVLRSRGLSATPEIRLSSIERIEPCKPRPPLTRGYFVVHFRENGVPRRRLVLLPGSLSGGGREFEHARRVLERAGLLDFHGQSAR